jgi:hypothetical protein
VVANGWLYRDTGEVRFWQQSDALVQGAKLDAVVPTAKLVWGFNQGSARAGTRRPPHYGSDGPRLRRDRSTAAS